MLYLPFAAPDGGFGNFQLCTAFRMQPATFGFLIVDAAALHDLAGAVDLERHRDVTVQRARRSRSAASWPRDPRQRRRPSRSTASGSASRSLSRAGGAGAACVVIAGGGAGATGGALPRSAGRQAAGGATGAAATATFCVSTARRRDDCRQTLLHARLAHLLRRALLRRGPVFFGAATGHVHGRGQRHRCARRARSARSPALRPRGRRSRGRSGSAAVTAGTGAGRHRIATCAVRCVGVVACSSAELPRASPASASTGTAIHGACSFATDTADATLPSRTSCVWGGCRAAPTGFAVVARDPSRSPRRVAVLLALAPALDASTRGLAGSRARATARAARRTSSSCSSRARRSTPQSSSSRRTARARAAARRPSG